MSKVKMRNTIANGGMTGTDEGINRIFAYRQGKTYSQVKKRVKQKASNTESQQLVRNAFTQSSQEWSHLTQGERDAYNVAAPNFANTDQFGTTAPSGKNLKTATAIVLATAGMPPSNVAPSTNFTSIIASSNVETNGQITLDYDCDFVLNPFERLQVAMSKPVSAGTSVTQKTTILKTCMILADGQSSVNLLNEFQQKYGAIVDGTKSTWEVFHITMYGYKKRISSGTTVLIS